MDLTRSTLLLYVARICKSVISFVAIIIFSRQLGSAPIGVYYSFLALLGIIAIPVDFGLKGATSKRISEGQDRSKFLGTAILLKTLILTPNLVLIFIGAPYINEYLGSNLADLFVITLVFRQAGSLGISVLRGELRVSETAPIEMLQPVSWLIVGFVLLSQGYGVHSLVYGYLVGAVLITVVSWSRVSTKIGMPTYGHAKSLLDFGRFSMISSVGGTIYSWMDVAILTLFATVGIVSRGSIGAYENAWRVSLLVAMFGEAISTTLMPQFSRWDAEDRRKQIEKIIPTAILAALLIAIPAFIGSILLSKEILGVLFGQEFVVGWLALIILTGHKIPTAIHTIVNPTLNAIDRPDLPAIAAAVTVLVNLVLNFLLIWEYGIEGAAIATAGSFVVNTILQTYFLNNILDLSLEFSFLVRGSIWSLFSSGVMGMYVYAVNDNFTISTIPELVTVVGTGAIVYLVILFLNDSIRDVGLTVFKRIAY